MSTASPVRHISAVEIISALSRHSAEELKEFQATWEDLPVDAYLADGATFRQRRYGAFRGVDALEPQPHGAFHQSTDVNKVFGGVQRHFPPLAEELASSPVLRTLVRGLADRVPGELDRETVGIGIHQIRIIARTEEDAAPPAPEGIHQDGHDYVAQVFMGREGVEGGESTIYDLERSPLLTTTLTNPFETIIIDDRRVFHGVSAVWPIFENVTGVRDMLLVDFFSRADD